MQKQRIVTVLILGLAFSGAASAQNRATPWSGDFWGYIGASGGESKFRADCRDTQFFECNKRDSGFKVYAGGKMNDIVGLEVGYTDFGRISASGGETKAWAVPLTLTVGMPLGSRFGIFGKVGGLYGHTDVTADPSTLFDTGHKTGWGWTYGAGATFAVTPMVQVRADWDRYKLDFVGGRQDIDMLTAGVQVRF